MRDAVICDACGKVAQKNIFQQVTVPNRWLTRKVPTGFMFQTKDQHFCTSECAHLYDEYKKEQAK